MSNFAHLHLHTEYSLLDGVNRIPDVIEKVSKDGMDAVAMTDHGVMNGFVEFWRVAKDFNVKPILGCELYVAPGSRKDQMEIDGIKYYHLVALAANKTGFHNLVKLVSLAHKEGYYYAPRVDRELLKQHSEGIIITSACLASPVARNILLGREKEAEEWIKFFLDAFPNRFYLELQRNGFEGSDTFKEEYTEKYGTGWAGTIKAQVRVNKKLRDFAAKYGLPLVATTDAHFLDAGDRDVQKVLFCIQDGITLENPRSRGGYWGTYVATQEEMLARFADDKEPLLNTLKVAEQVEQYEIAYDRVQPRFWGLKPKQQAKDLLRDLAYEGAKKKYGDVTPELKDRLELELEIIHEKGYDDYFLVVADLLSWSSEQGILTGTRGSVAGSVVAYCLDTVKIDPISWELYFERFLNPERPSPPDIDMDIQDSRRDELVTYAREKYGDECVMAICTFGRFQTKAAIRDVARVMGIDLAVADRLSKMVNVVFGKVWSIDKQMKEDAEFRQIIESDPQLIKLADTVRKISGLARNLSIHAAGYIITPEPVVEYTPIQKEARGENLITQLEFMEVEESGLMKFDFLGLRTLTILANALNYIKKDLGISITLEDIPNDDKKTFKLFAKGETVGIFQFESPPMRRYLMELHPETQEDLCFMAAAYRPGPMQYIPDYILRKQGKQKTEYLIPEMETILANTYGFAIYQEQVIRIAVDVAGYTMGGADKLRKAMGKKILEVMEKEEPKFKEGVIKKGYDKGIADKLWDYLLPFADYGFNKAHAAVYAVIAYQCAYLKAHYPLQYMTALLHSDLTDSDRVVIDIKEAQRMGFSVLAPDVNESDVYFSIQGKDSIRFGLAAVKNVGIHVCENIVKARAERGRFESLDDLIEKVGPENLNKKALECLVMVGALDQFGERNRLLAVLPGIMERVGKQRVIMASGQKGLFGGPDKVGTAPSAIQSSTPLPNLDPLADSQKLQWEKELMGIFLSTHPLEKFFWARLLPDIYNIEKLEAMKAGVKVKVLVVLDEIKKIRTKIDNKPMAFLTLTDLTGSCEAVLFNSIYTEYQDKLKASQPYIVEGSVSFRDDKASIIIDKITQPDDLKEPEKIRIDICDISNKIELESIKQVLANEGDVVVEILYGPRFHPKRLERKIALQPSSVDNIYQYVVKQPPKQGNGNGKRNGFAK